MADTKKSDSDRDAAKIKKADLKGKKDLPADVFEQGTPPTTSEPEQKSDALSEPPKEAEAPSESKDSSSPGSLPDTEEPTPVQSARRSSFVPALIGGVVAAILGFIAAQTEVLSPILPGGQKNAEMAEAITALQEANETQAEMLAALKVEIASAGQSDLGPLEAHVSTNQADIASLRVESDAREALLHDLETRLAPLASRVEQLEKRPMTEGASETAIAAYDRELLALRDAIAAQRADVEKMIDEARATKAAARALEEDAAAAARTVQNQAIVTRLLVALDNGAGYAPILADLVKAGVAVPDVLNASANDGVATLAELTDAFPAAARASLSAARSEEDNGGGLKGFFQRQLGARSVQPREGDDADAILSRAEAAVTTGDLSKALAEIATLPELAHAKMQGWVEVATTRQAALSAANELAQSLNTN